MQSQVNDRSEASAANTIGEYIGAALAVIISLILLTLGATLVGMLGLGPIGAFWFGVFVTILILGFVAWTVFVLLFVAHFATISRFI